MKVSKFENVYQITIFPKIFPINCFVIEKDTHLIVIDMGMTNFIKEVQSISNKTNKPVSHLLLTHAHADHTNGVSQFKEEFPTAKVGISERDQKLLDGDFTLRGGEAEEKIKGGFSKKTVPTDFNFEETVEDISIIETPGHTPGSVSFLDNETKFIFTGDAFQTKGGLAVSGKLNITFPFPKFATWSYETAVSSAKIIIDKQPAALYVGHGDMIKNPVDPMKQAVKTAQTKLK